MTQKADRQDLRKILSDYNEKCKILKQIHSNKSGRYRTLHANMTIGTIAISVIVTGFGFMDKNRIVDFFSSDQQVIESVDRKSLTIEDPKNATKRHRKIDTVTMIFDISVLIILTLTIVGLAYRWQERSVEHNRAVVILADLANDIDDLLRFSMLSEEDLYIQYEIIRAKYKVIADFLPQNTDEEFLQARTDYDAKQKNKKPNDSER